MLRLLLLSLCLLLTAGCAQNRLPETCSLLPESGKCRASFMRYWYDDRAGTCKGFIWGGCGGVVPFESLDACHAACMPGQPMPEAPMIRRGGSTEGN